MSEAPAAASPALPAPPRALLESLVHALGPGSVLQGDDLALRNTSDWSGAAPVRPAAVLLPRTTQEVASAVRLCREHRWPLAVQGGLTGLAGGANAQPGEIALSLARLNVIEDIETMGGLALVQAGVTLEALQAAVCAQGWSFPLDLGARGSCQLGGNAATNAGGNSVLRHGMMRNLVRGLEVVLADGTVLDMLDSVIKNNAGFDLKQLFIGSEGTLGIITRLSLALVPLPAGRRTVLCAVGDFHGAAALLAEGKRTLAEMSAFELMWRDYFEASLAALGRQRPFAAPSPLYVLLETQGAETPAASDAIEAFLESGIEKGWVSDAIVAQTGTQAAELWDIREGVSELLAIVKPCAAFDVSVALPRMDALVSRLRELLSRAFAQQQHLFFGHLGDGNLHLISGPFADSRQLEQAEELVYATVGEFGGSISAEHGIGMAKRSFLHHSRHAGEIELMRKLKHLLDPQAILNPGRIFAA
jgi:FAD/FMN-containing dehydrogenase